MPLHAHTHCFPGEMKKNKAQKIRSAKKNVAQKIEVQKNEAQKIEVQEKLTLYSMQIIITILPSLILDLASSFNQPCYVSDGACSNEVCKSLKLTLFLCLKSLILLLPADNQFYS